MGEAKIIRDIVMKASRKSSQVNLAGNKNVIFCKQLVLLNNKCYAHQMVDLRGRKKEFWQVAASEPVAASLSQPVVASLSSLMAASLLMEPIPGSAM